VIYSFKPEMAFVDKVKPGDTFKIRTNDCFLGQIKSETQDFYTIDESKVNPATGPIFVNGAEPGDLLKVEVLDIEVNSKGVAVIIPGEGLLGNKVVKPHIRVIPVTDGHIQFGDLLIPARPMIGVIGVAPSHAEGEWPTDTPWKHGGNMDATDMAKGSTLFLPVSQKGALLAVGDCHALMGDGEVGVSGCEIAAEVTLRVDLIKGKTTHWPLLETGDHTMVIASGDTLEEATFNAVDETVKYLQKGLALSWEDAYILSSLVVDVKINQVVNPKKTVRATIPKSLIKTDLIINSV
jgi:amidase